MKLSNSTLLSISIFCCSLVACNKGEARHDDALPESNTKPKIAHNNRDSISPKIDTINVSYNSTIEGYKASELGCAIFSGDLEKVKVLLNNGASIEKCLSDETYEFDGLYAAIALIKIDVLNYFLEKKLYTNINQVYTGESETPITLACALDDKDAAVKISQVLILNGAKVDGAGDSGGETTKIGLFIAISKNNLELVRLLLNHHAKKDILNKEGKTPLSIAEENGYADIVALLEK